MGEFQGCRVHDVSTLDLGKVSKNDTRNFFWSFSHSAIRVLPTWNPNTTGKLSLTSATKGKNCLDGLPLGLGVQIWIRRALRLGFKECILVLLHVIGYPLAELEGNRTGEFLNIAQSQKVGVQQCRTHPHNDLPEEFCHIVL